MLARFLLPAILRPVQPFDSRVHKCRCRCGSQQCGPLMQCHAEDIEVTCNGTIAEQAEKSFHVMAFQDNQRSSPLMPS